MLWMIEYFIRNKNSLEYFKISCKYIKIRSLATKKKDDINHLNDNLTK